MNSYFGVFVYMALEQTFLIMKSHPVCTGVSLHQAQSVYRKERRVVFATMDPDDALTSLGDPWTSPWQMLMYNADYHSYVYAHMLADDGHCLCR